MSANNDLVLRGEDAARARRIDLVAPQVTQALEPTGPFRTYEQEAYDKARKEGFLKGRIEGHDRALREGMEEARQQTEAALSALNAVRAGLEQQLSDLSARLSAEVTNLALEIAEAILEREISCASDPGGEAIARCLELAPDVGDVVAHLNPVDLELLGEISGLGDRELHVVPDTRLERGDAVVRVDDALVDGRLASALERVAEVLR